MKLELITKTIGMIGFRISKYSPQLLVVGGIVAGGAALVTACRSARRMDPIIEEHKRMVEDVKLSKDNGFYENELEYSKNLTIAYVNTGWKLVKLYSKPALLALLSASATLCGVHILNTRYVGAVAAYNVVSDQFKRYRDNVVADLGEEADRKYRFSDLLQRDIVEKVDEKGKPYKASVPKKDPGYIDFSVMYDEGNENYSRNAANNLMRIDGVLAAANEILNRRGYLYLDEVYEMLGYKMGDKLPWAAAHNVGWLADKKYGGDGEVSFGIHERAAAGDERAQAFLDLAEPSILLDFNHQGIISTEVDSFLKEGWGVCKRSAPGFVRRLAYA